MSQTARNGTIEISILIEAPAEKIWQVITSPEKGWGKAFGGGATAETDWKEGSLITWKDVDGNIGAKGKVIVNDPGHDLTLEYWENVDAPVSAPLGPYVEKFTLVRKKDEQHQLLTAECAPVEDTLLEKHTDMWKDAVEMIKELAEKHN